MLLTEQLLQLSSLFFLLTLLLTLSTLYPLASLLLPLTSSLFTPLRFVQTEESLLSFPGAVLSLLSGELHSARKDIR